MSADHPIPAPRMWNQAEGHVMADDCADWACTHMPRLVAEDLDRRIEEKRAFIPQGCEQQGRLQATIQPTEAASAVSGIGFENEPAPKRRLGPLTAIERRLLRREPTFTWAVVVMLSLACAIRLLWGAS